MLPGHGNRDLFRHPPMTAVYTVRPYSAKDQVRILTASLPGSVLIRVHMRTCVIPDYRSKGLQGDAERGGRRQSPYDDAATTDQRWVMKQRSVWDFFLFFCFPHHIISSSLTLQPVLRGSAPLPWKCLCNGGRRGGVRLWVCSHRCQISCSQVSGDHGSMLLFSIRAEGDFAQRFSLNCRGRSAPPCVRTSPPWLDCRCCPESPTPHLPGV